MGREGKRSTKGQMRSLRDLSDNVYGEPNRPMKDTQLPTWKDVGLHLSDLLKTCGLKHQDAVLQTEEKVVEIYQRASIPTIPISSIQRKIGHLLQLKRNQ